MNRIILPYIILLFFVFSCAPVEKGVAPSHARYENLEFEMPVVSEPVIPDYTVSITDFGAVSGGQILNSKAFADAIDHVSARGGGRVIIPRGLWLTGPIILKSNINIHTEEGALVIFSADKDLYPLIETSFEGYNTVRCLSPVYGKNLENIAFTGKGIFDGTGEVWRPVKKSKTTESQWKTLVRSGGIVDKDGKTWYPSASYQQGQKISEMNVPRQLQSIEDYKAIKDFLRPVMVSLIQCNKVLFDGPVFQNSPAWCIHPLMCENLTIRNIMVKNPWYSQNGDGLDIESCRNALVHDCSFDVGDDAICIKSGKDEDGRKRGLPTENVVIRNCIVYHGHGGITIGSEMSGGVRNIHASGCTFIGTDVGLRFKSTRGRGGTVENIFYSDIDMINIPTYALSFNLYYNGLSVPEMLEEEKNKGGTGTYPPVTEETPRFRNISIRNITCKGAMQALFLQGLPELNLENVILENIYMEADNGFTCMDANGVYVRNIRLVVKNKPAIQIYNSMNVDIAGLDVPNMEDTGIEIRGEKTENIRIKSVTPSVAGTAAVIGEEVKATSIEIL